MPEHKQNVAEVQQAVRKGAITTEYRADAEKIIQALNNLRSTEIMSYLQYMQHQYMAVSLLSPGMKAEFEAHATQELDHANRLAERGTATRRSADLRSERNLLQSGECRHQT